MDSAGILHVFVREPEGGASMEMEIERYGEVGEEEVLQMRPILEAVSA